MLNLWKLVICFLLYIKRIQIRNIFFCKQVPEIEEFNASVDWGLSDNSNSVHPIYLSKCLEKVLPSLMTRTKNYLFQVFQHENDLTNQ